MLHELGDPGADRKRSSEDGVTLGNKPNIPRVMSQRTMKRLLEENGWVETTGGKHSVKMEKEGCRPITLPMHKRRDYPPGLTDAILRQAGLKGGES